MGRENYFIVAFMEKFAAVGPFLSGMDQYPHTYGLRKALGRGILGTGLVGAGIYKLTKSPDRLPKGGQQ